MRGKNRKACDSWHSGQKSDHNPIVYNQIISAALLCSPMTSWPAVEVFLNVQWDKHSIIIDKDKQILYTLF